MKAQYVSGPVFGLLLALPLIACSDASGTKDPVLDGAIPDTVGTRKDVPTAVSDVPQAPDLLEAPALDAQPTGDAAPDVAALDTPTLEVPAPDTYPIGDAVPDGGATCLWPTAIRYTLPHFDFTVTAPNGTEYTRMNSGADAGLDAGAPLSTPLVGRVTEVQGTLFKVDTCIQGSSCQPAVYTFKVSVSPSFNTSADIQLKILAGKTIRVDWALSRSLSFSPGLASLSVLDDDPGTRGNLLFAGASGMEVSTNTRYSSDSLPFTASLQALNCKLPRMDGAASWADDFAMVATPKNGQGQSLKLATGETGPLEYTTQTGATDRVRIHCLDAVQPSATDDYWNWDFWVESDLPTRDGGTP